MKFRISDHAQFECERRQIPMATLQNVLDQPDQIVAADRGRIAYQSRVQLGEKDYLVRAIIDLGEDPAVVITVYRTSKLDKYWRFGE